MMKSAVFNILFLLVSITGFSQKIGGTILSDSGAKLASVEIFIKASGQRFSSDSDGNFSVSMDKPGNYELVFYKENYQVTEQNFTTDETQNIVLAGITNLSEVVISRQKEIFALKKLKDIEGTAIYAGKKTEVISLDLLTANKAVNNPRQVFSQVAGLTINESSDGGLQLSIGGRGLNPNRTSNFNTRQNDYDISADVLGYPESYYATPTEALDQIQIIRGAASLQYGTQFGGLVNFKLKSPSLKPMEILTRNTLGSYGLYTNFSSLSGTKGKFSYYTFFNFKTGDGFRPNSHFDSRNFFANLNYQFTDKTSLHFDYTYFDYLAKQPGGLTDEMFQDDASQSNRSRNWFDVNWNLFALRLKHKFSADADFSLQLFGLDASRKAIGYRSNRVANPDSEGAVRDLILGDFVNWGAEARYLKRYQMGNYKNALLLGVKYYQSRNTGLQGPGSSGSNADFSPAFGEFPNYENQSDYTFPNLNLSFFGEHIFRFGPKFSVTPGFRVEKIRTRAEGFYRRVNVDLAGNIILDQTTQENITKDRHFILLGVGVSYKPKSQIEIYGNISQNYRSVTFSDIRTANPSQEIAPDITDEKGYTSDIGIRGQIGEKLVFDASVFGLLYHDKIGEFDTKNSKGLLIRYRDNLGTAITYGFETLLDWNLGKTFFAQDDNFKWNVFSNLAVTGSQYLKSDIVTTEGESIKGHEVEFVPLLNLKTGTGIGYKNFMASIQLTYLSDQFTSANITDRQGDAISDGVSGKIPDYYVADISASYKWKTIKLEAGINNFTDNKYFTRRATGYPGPGIIPSDLRTFYTTLEIRF